jgi:hypothetical protein
VDDRPKMMMMLMRNECKRRTGRGISGRGSIQREIWGEVKNKKLLPCNPTYSGGRDQEECGWKPVLANSLQDPLKKAHRKKKGLKGLSSEFKPKFRKEGTKEGRKEGREGGREGGRKRKKGK